MWILYEAVFWVALILASPYYLLRMKRRGGYASGFMERFGCFTEEKQNRLRDFRPVWIHAVSVGEVDLALRLIEQWQKQPHCPKLALSTTTSTGYALALQKLRDSIPVFYNPLDSRFCFKKVHRLISPQALILMEAELWPNHLRFCGKRNIPVMLINARISERFYPRYRRFHWVFEKAFKSFKLVTLQNESDNPRLENLGFPRESLLTIGSLKYDTAKGVDLAKREKLHADLKILKPYRLWIAGSTHPGEEAVALQIYQSLKPKFPDLKLALAPRHAERTPEIVQLLHSQRASFALRSTQPNGEKPFDVLLLDTTGELKYLYEMATVIFIGKSLLGRGGQNLIEPAALGKPVLFGPHMENFQSIVQDFLEAGAAIQVRDQQELLSKTEFLLTNTEEASKLARNAENLVRNKSGVLEKTLQAIQKTLSK
jgi:3-deoxy-D-manno-octulosonic-acid transferase